MRRNKYQLFKKVESIFLIISVLMLVAPTVLAEKAPLITSVDELTSALVNARPGDTILVGDISFRPMPMGIIPITQNVTIKSGKEENAVFTNATFGLNGTTSNTAPLTVTFENIDFRGDQYGMSIDTDSPPMISSEMPGVMKTMCATIFKMNVNASYTGCSFEGYHYGYGGVFSALYSTEDNRNTLNLSLNDCVFRNNASKFGGCMYLLGYSHNINLDARHCVFENNAATTGGAIWAEKCNLHLLDCSLTENRYLKNSEVELPNGGALALYNCGTELDGCFIADNYSGGEGAGIYCDITPFKTLIMENCTVFGNTSKNDEGISLGFVTTDFDTTAKAHIYFSSLIGENNLDDRTELVGSLLVNDNVMESEPNEENGYCYKVTLKTAQEKGFIPKTPEHIVLSEDKYRIPKELIQPIAGGKFANSLGELHIGDNYQKEAILEIKETPKHTETITVRYGDKIVLEPSERRGYSLLGWEYPIGTPIENSMLFIGGKLPEGKIIAQWHFNLFDSSYILWISIFVLGICGIIDFAYTHRKKKTVLNNEIKAENEAENTVILPGDWIEKVCVKKEIAETISKREMEVLKKLLEGKSRKQIAEELFVTEATIKKHSASIYAKLDVHNRTELIYKLTNN